MRSKIPSKPKVSKNSETSPEAEGKRMIATIKANIE